MKFRIEDKAVLPQTPSVRVGNVYPAKGGARAKIAMWVVIGVDEGSQRVHLVGLNDIGEMRSTCSYGIWAMQSRDVIGRVEGLDELEFTVEPTPAAMHRTRACPSKRVVPRSNARSRSTEPKVSCTAGKVAELRCSSR